MSNFSFLLSHKEFATFGEVAMAAEKILHIDPAACILNCRRAMEFAIKWMYSVDKDLEMPYQDNLQSLMNREAFRRIVGKDLYTRMDFIRVKGNHAAHSTGKKISEDQALLCLENLHIFLDFVAYCYAETYEERTFDPTLIPSHLHSVTPVTAKDSATSEKAQTSAAEKALAQLMEENKKLREQLTARREEHQQTYVPKPLEISEYETRKFYIDAMLEDAGWIEGKDWRNEVMLPSSAGESAIGIVDYVLYDDNRRPLAIIEARRTCEDVSQGRTQAERHAEFLAMKHGRKPVIFLTNGFETRIADGLYPERNCAAIYSKRDLEKLFHLRTGRISLNNITTKKNIADRYYQKEAVKAVCDAFRKDLRKALLVMATGTGKTRTVIMLCDILLHNGWVKNILFLADRSSLVTQAMRSFTKLLPERSCVNLCEDRDNHSAHCVFSTYEAITEAIDSVKDTYGKRFTCGYFDLVICDEAHPSICSKHRDVLNYFDALLVGLTASPKNEIDKDIYEMFSLENGIPTYSYELAQAVKDGYLVDFISVETKLKFSDQGIPYDELSDTEREAYEATFEDEDHCKLPDRIVSSTLNEWVFNDNTIRQALRILMTHGQKINHGKKLGKTIIFAQNHGHGEKIRKIFNKEYPHLPGFAKVIDSRVRHAQALIDDFSNPGKLPQIAISIDVLDTGIDVPECLNLVFFKKVMSKAKFRQMIGRGTRLCAGLKDGKDKDTFFVFDFCSNFEFFRMSKEKSTADQIRLPGAVFCLKAQLTFKLQGENCKTPELIQYRKSLVGDMARSVQNLSKENFAVRQHLKFVELYANPDNYEDLTYETTQQLRHELAPLMTQGIEDEKVLHFDGLMYTIELAYLDGKKHTQARADLVKAVSAVSAVATVPERKLQESLIRKILHTDYLDTADIHEFEHIRESLRDLIKFVPGEKILYSTNIANDK